VVQSVGGSLGVQTAGQVAVLFCQGTADLLLIGMQFSDFFEERLMEEEVDIFDVVVGFVLAFDFLSGFSGVDSFQDTQAPVCVCVCKERGKEEGEFWGDGSGGD